MNKTLSHTCYIALGSNLDNPVSHINRAVDELAELPCTQLINVSTLYQSPALTNLQQRDYVPDYVNAVLSLETSLPPFQLLDCLQTIEHHHDRIRTEEKWAARTLDLDILLYADEIICHDRLTIPHYDLKNRYFFLYPLFEIQPELTLPCGEEIKGLLARCHKTSLTPLS